MSTFTSLKAVLEKRTERSSNPFDSLRLLIMKDSNKAELVSSMNPADVALAFKLTLSEAKSLKTAASFANLANTLSSKSNKPTPVAKPRNSIEVLIECNKGAQKYIVTSPGELGVVLESAKNNNQPWLILDAEYAWVQQVEKNVLDGYSYIEAYLA